MTIETANEDQNIWSDILASIGKMADHGYLTEAYLAISNAYEGLAGLIVTDEDFFNMYVNLLRFSTFVGSGSFRNSIESMNEVLKEDSLLIPSRSEIFATPDCYTVLNTKGTGKYIFVYINDSEFIVQPLEAKDGITLEKVKDSLTTRSVYEVANDESFFVNLLGAPLNGVE